MKKLLILLLLVPCLSWGNILLPLEKYITQQDLNDSAVMEYIEYRCASVWSAVSNVLSKQDPVLSEKFHNNVLTIFMRLVSKKMVSDEIDINSASTMVNNSLTNIGNLYMDEMNSNWEKSGNYLMNTYVEDDSILCKEILSE